MIKNSEMFWTEEIFHLPLLSVFRVHYELYIYSACIIYVPWTGYLQTTSTLTEISEVYALVEKHNARADAVC